MAWTFVQRLADEPAAGELVRYRMQITNGVETRTESHKAAPGLTAPQLLAVRTAILNAYNNPPPERTTKRDIVDRLRVIAQDDVTYPTKATKWDAVVAFRASIVGDD